MEVEYDQLGRMKYHPDLHDKQGEPWTVEDTEYLCKYAEIDDLEFIALALGRTTATVGNKLSRLKKEGQYEHFRNLNKNW